MKFFGTLKTVGPFMFWGEVRKVLRQLKDVQPNWFCCLPGTNPLKMGPWVDRKAMNRSSRVAVGRLWKPKTCISKGGKKMQLLRAVDQVARHFGNDFCNDFRRSSLARLLKCWSSQTQQTTVIDKLFFFWGGNILSPSFSMHFSMHLWGNKIPRLGGRQLALWSLQFLGCAFWLSNPTILSAVVGSNAAFFQATWISHADNDATNVRES